MGSWFTIEQRSLGKCTSSQYAQRLDDVLTWLMMPQEQSRAAARVTLHAHALRVSQRISCRHLGARCNRGSTHPGVSQSLCRICVTVHTPVRKNYLSCLLGLVRWKFLTHGFSFCTSNLRLYVCSCCYSNGKQLWSVICRVPFAGAKTLWAFGTIFLYTLECNFSDSYAVKLSELARALLFTHRTFTLPCLQIEFHPIPGTIPAGAWQQAHKSHRRTQTQICFHLCLGKTHVTQQQQTPTRRSSTRSSASSSPTGRRLLHHEIGRHKFICSAIYCEVKIAFIIARKEIM